MFRASVPEGFHWFADLKTGSKCHCLRSYHGAECNEQRRERAMSFLLGRIEVFETIRRSVFGDG